MTRQLFEHHPRLGYRYIPGLRARVRHEGGGYLLAVNADGFRSTELSADPAREQRRVFVFGDSFTAGDGVSDGQRFTDHLQRSGGAISVHNFGLPGTGTDQHYLAYREFGAPHRHELLVIAVLVENIRRVAAPYRGFVTRGTVAFYPKPYFTADGDRLDLHGVPVPKGALDATALQAAVDGSRLRELTRDFSRSRPVPEYDDADGYGWRLLRAVLLAWIDEARAAHPDTPVLVVPLPLFSHVEGDADPANYQQRFAELAHDRGIAVHDPLPDLLRHPAAERRAFRFAKDIHPTRAGHQALAESLAPVVTGLLAEPPATVGAGR
jgi:hypothetical protein